MLLLHGPDNIGIVRESDDGCPSNRIIEKRASHLTYLPLFFQRRNSFSRWLRRYSWAGSPSNMSSDSSQLRTNLSKITQIYNYTYVH